MSLGIHWPDLLSNRQLKTLPLQKASSDFLLDISGCEPKAAGYISVSANLNKPDGETKEQRGTEPEAEAAEENTVLFPKQWPP